MRKVLNEVLNKLVDWFLWSVFWSFWGFLLFVVVYNIWHESSERVQYWKIMSVMFAGLFVLVSAAGLGQFTKVEKLENFIARHGLLDEFIAEDAAEKR